MARQGNYVTIPGVDPNWAKGISSALSDLSRSYNQRAAQEEAALEREATAAENKRRYEADRARQLQQDAYRKERDSILDARALAQDEESKRRWDLQEQRRAQAEKERLEGIQAERDARNAAWTMATDPTAQKFELGDYTEPLQQSFTDLTSRVTGERDAVLGFLQSEGDDVQAASASYRKNLEASDLPPSRVDEMVAQREADLRSLKDEFVFGDFSPEQINSRIDQLSSSRYGNRLSEIEERIRTGAGLTQEEKVRALLNDIDPKVRANLDVTEAQELLKSVVTGPTRDSLVAAEQARVEQANETMLKNIELYDDYIGRANASGKSYSSNVKGMSDALKDMGKIDIGWIDTADAKEGFQTLIAKGIDPEIAAASVAFGIDRGLVGDSFPSTTSTEFAKIEQQAELLQKGKRTGSGGKVFIDRDAYTYKPEQARSLAELQRSSIGFTPGDNSRLALNPEFDLSRRVDPAPRFNTEPLRGAVDVEVSGADAKAAANKTVLPQPKPLKEGEAANLPPEYQAVAETIDPELREVLDLTWPEVKSTARGTRSDRTYTEQELLSREILDVVRQLENSKKALATAQNRSGRNYNQFTVATHQDDVNSAEARLKALRDQLLNP